MKMIETTLAGLQTVQLDRIDDARGHLVRVFDALEWAPKIGDLAGWAQVVTSFTATKNTLRGMHYQLPPFAEGKLVVPLTGSMYWASVDVRPDSPTFGRWRGETLEAVHGTALAAAPGFAHGCLSLTDDVTLLILSTQTHRADGGAGFRWDDPSVAIKWPDLGAPPHLSPAHRRLPRFDAFAEGLGIVQEREAVHA
jgi:dTDP-4-dehydrorhamnose 3,5-epimerase